MLRHPPVLDGSGICYGRVAMTLAPGWEALAARWAGPLARVAPARVWTSPSHRCAAVAEVLAGRVRAPLFRDDRLLELAFGEWEGRPWEAVPRGALDRWAQDPLGFAPPGGESGGALVARVREFALMLRREARPCLVVSHGGPLRLLPALLRGEAPDLLAPSPATGSLAVHPAQKCAVAVKVMANGSPGSPSAYCGEQP